MIGVIRPWSIVRTFLRDHPDRSVAVQQPSGILELRSVASLETPVQEDVPRGLGDRRSIVQEVVPRGDSPGAGHLTAVKWDLQQLTAVKWDLRGAVGGITRDTGQQRKKTFLGDHPDRSVAEYSSQVAKS